MLPLPRLPAHWAGCWGLLPTCCGFGCAGLGAQHCPLGLHALWRLRAAGVVGGRPRGGWPATVVRGVWCQALSPPAARPLGRAAGVLRPVCPGCGRCGRGDQHRAHSARPCGPALHAVGVAEGRPRGGGAFAVVKGVWGQALPLPRLPALWADCPGPLPTCCGRGCAGVGALHQPRGSRALSGAVGHGGGGGCLGSGAPSSLLPALRAGCRGPLGTCCGRGCGCVRCVWCFCGACGGAWCRLSPVPLMLPSPVLRCGVVPAVCRVPAALPYPRASLARLLATPCFFRGFVALYRSLPFPLLPLLPGMHFFPASAVVGVSVFFLASSSFSLARPCEIKGVWQYVGSVAQCGRRVALTPHSLPPCALLRSI